MVVTNENADRYYDDVQHHDIIGHRVVNYKATYEPTSPQTSDKNELKEKLHELRKELNETDRDYPHIQKVIDAHWDD